MGYQKIAKFLVELTGSIIPQSQEDHKALKRLRENIAIVYRRDTDLNISEASTLFQFEQIDTLIDNPLGGIPLFKEMADLSKKIVLEKDQTPDTEYLVFRRTTPSISTLLPGAVPAWGAGSLVAFTEGPFLADNGLTYWFDFYQLTKTISVFIGNETAPSLLVPVRIFLFAHSQTAYKIEGESIWIRSNLFSGDAPSGHYTGLKISGGTMHLSIQGSMADHTLKLPAGASINLKLDLVQPDAALSSLDEYGKDAVDASIQLPSSVEIQMEQNDLSILAMAQAQWNLYQDRRNFDLQRDEQPTYSKQLKKILIPCIIQPNNIQISEDTLKSPWFGIKGDGTPRQAAWTLPTASINISSPPIAAGIGGLAVLFDTAMQCNWLGLEGGGIKTNATWFQLEPGIIILSSEKASNILAHHYFDLWESETTGLSSEARLQFTSEFPLTYYSLSNGYELLYTHADTDIQTDRPVKVNGQPFVIKGKDSYFMYLASFHLHSILLFDPNILVDNQFNARSTNSFVIYEPNAIALNNSILTITKPISFFMTGRLEGNKKLKRGNLILQHGLFSFLPILPDPYAANLAVFLRGQYSNSLSAQQRYFAYLSCSVTWAINEVSGDFNTEVSYKFFPLRNDELVRLGFDTLTYENTTTAQERDDYDLTSFSYAAQRRNTYDPNKYELPWRDRLNQFGRDVFSLLDVSTNADLMGISYGHFDTDVILKITHQVVEGNQNENETPIPFEIEGMDLKASGQFVKAFTVPQISWEPVINLSDPQLNTDPPTGFLGFQNDGGATRIFNTSTKTVTLAPIPVTNFLVESFHNEDEIATYSLFTLPNGLQAMAGISPKNHFTSGEKGSEFEFNQPEFDNDVKGGIQLKTTGAYNKRENNRTLKGNTLQLTNLISSKINATSILGESVTEIFNNEFSAGGQFGFFTDRGVPVERIDFSGYGASMFSNWLNNDAKFSQTSQAKFDVLLGRTILSVIQVCSAIYPWGIRVVRTITVYRVGSGYVYRVDSGWRAESDGEFDFNITVEQLGASNFSSNYENYYAEFTPPPYQNGSEVKNLRPYSFYPGVIKKISNVKNIRETTDYNKFSFSRIKAVGEVFMDSKGVIRPVEGTSELGKFWDVNLTPVRFTANVHIDDVKEGAVGDIVPCKEMIGYIQITPAGTPIPTDALTQLLNERPEIGGQLDCVIDIGKTGQLKRISRIEFAPSLKTGNKPIFVGVAKGTPILPKDGSWSLVQHDANTNEVTLLKNEHGVPLIRSGEWRRNAIGKWSANQASEPYRIANPLDLFNLNPGKVFNYAFLQNTGSQKILFTLPSFEAGKKLLQSKDQYFADAYHLLNSQGQFPNLNDIAAKLDFDAENKSLHIIKEGFQLIQKGTEGLLNPVKETLKKKLPPGPWYWVGTKDGDEPVKIYLRYSTSEVANSVLDFELDSAAKKWTSTMNDTSIVVDLAGMKELFIVRGSFDSRKGSPISVNKPVLEVGPDLKPIYDVLVILAELSASLDTGNYGNLLEKGLEVAMSNSPGVLEYKFSARKEIPVLRFPPPMLDSPIAPLRLEASLALGAYFNMDTPITTDVKQLIPSAGAYVEFYAQLSVMCVSLAAATVYAVGQTNVKVYGDLKSGPGIAMRYGFGVELAVGLPVVGTVSILYMVGIEMNLSTNEISVGAFLLFKGRAELLGGIVTVTIYIEAKGTIIRKLPSTSGGETLMEAQVTFGLEISIFWVIDISFEESWKETRQIG